MHRIILPLLAGLLFSTAAGAEIYKCRLPSGKVEISNTPCPSGSGTVTVRPDDNVPEASRQQAERDVERMRIVARALRKEGSWSTPTTGPRGPSEALTASAALAHAAESPSHDREAAPDAPVTAGPAAPASRGRWFLDRAEGASSAATSSATAASALRVRDAGSARAGRMRA